MKKVVIGKQGAECEQYYEFCKIIKEKQIPVIVVRQGDIINIERNVKIRVLFPGNELIGENIINNNSLVFKIESKEFKALFTGDIEEIAEYELIKMYNSNELKANILKVPHHGSKTSSTEEFLKEILPSVALIGVGKNNNFGHPNSDVLVRLKNYGAKIYRTDQDREVSIIVNKKGEISLKRLKLP